MFILIRRNERRFFVDKMLYAKGWVISKPRRAFFRGWSQLHGRMGKLNKKFYFCFVCLKCILMFIFNKNINLEKLSKKLSAIKKNFKSSQE